MSTFRPSLVVLTLLGALALPGVARAADFLVFPLKVSLPVQRIIIGFEVDQLLKTTLKEKDLVNLALGRPRGTKVDKKTAVLAVALTTEGPSSSPLARVIVFDPSQTGTAAITAVVATLTTLDFDAAGAKGQGTATVAVQQTPGGAVPDALRPSSLFATGPGTVGSLALPGLETKVVLQGAIGGRMAFTSQGEAIDGFVVGGKAKVSGKVLGSFSQ
jgi:hypothetical protein